LSGDQRRAVERARDFLRAAAAGQRTLAAHLDAGCSLPIKLRRVWAECRTKAPALAVEHDQQPPQP